MTAEIRPLMMHQFSRGTSDSSLAFQLKEDNIRYEHCAKHYYTKFKRFAVEITAGSVHKIDLGQLIHAHESYSFAKNPLGTVSTVVLERQQQDFRTSPIKHGWQRRTTHLWYAVKISRRPT